MPLRSGYGVITLNRTLRGFVMTCQRKGSWHKMGHVVSDNGCGLGDGVLFAGRPNEAQNPERWLGDVQ